ncbi:MAG: hypothetical protein GX958_10535 [Desulfitobacterium sp.]|nr:hypothetical protein [Desulfitobacterium sp.]
MEYPDDLRSCLVDIFNKLPDMISEALNSSEESVLETTHHPYSSIKLHIESYSINIDEEIQSWLKKINEETFQYVTDFENNGIYLKDNWCNLPNIENQQNEAGSFLSPAIYEEVL